jgi:hypothetical protein
MTEKTPILLQTIDDGYTAIIKVWKVWNHYYWTEMRTIHPRKPSSLNTKPPKSI